MAIEGELTELASGSGGYETRSAPMMNMQLAIHHAPVTSGHLRPNRSIPMMRNMPVAMTLTVP